MKIRENKNGCFMCGTEAGRLTPDPDHELLLCENHYFINEGIRERRSRGLD